MKKRAIRAELRKESKTFPGYFKYELDVQFKDGTIKKNIPAYGKDLQDALSRTVYIIDFQEDEHYNAPYD